MATARRRNAPQEQDLYGPAKPAAWLSPQELTDMPVEEQHRLAATRRRSVLEDYARQHRMLVGDVDRRFLVHPDRRFTDRAETLRWLARHGWQGSGDIERRRRARLATVDASLNEQGCAN